MTSRDKTGHNTSDLGSVSPAIRPSGDIEFYPAFRASLCRPMIAGVVHQNLPHESGGYGNEVLTVLGLKWALFRQTQIGFVHQRGGLQRMRGTLTLQVMMSKTVEFVVDKGNEGVQGLAISRFPPCD
jgi:hypothetical protein